MINPPEGGYTTVNKAADAMSELLNSSDEFDKDIADDVDEPSNEEVAEGLEESQGNEEVADGEEKHEVEGDEEYSLESFEDLTQVLDVDTDTINNLLVNTKVDGVSEKVTLKDLIAGYQTKKYNTQRSQAFAEERKAQEEAMQKRHQEVDGRLHAYGNMLQALESSIVGQLNGEEMQALRVSDPQQYMLRTMDIQRTQQNLENFKQQAANLYQQNRQQAEAERDAKIKKLLQESRAKLPEVIPDWGEETQSKIAKYALDSGIEKDRLENIVDWRDIQILNKARLYDELQSKTKSEVKRIKKTPIKIKKAQSKADTNAKNRVRSESMKAYKKAPNRKTAQAAIESLLE